MKRKRVGILVFPNVGILDFCGPYDVFTVTRLDENRRRGVVHSFDRLVRPLGSLVTADRGSSLNWSIVASRTG